MATANLRAELVGRIHDWVHFAPELFLGSRQCASDGGQRHVPDDQQVDVAGPAQLAAGGRSKDESDENLACERRESFAKNLCGASRLHDQPMKLDKDR